MKSYFKLILPLLMLPLPSKAAWPTYLYERDFLSAGRSYISKLSQTDTDRLQDLDRNKRAICENRYDGILKDGVLDIRIILGYFDWTTGSAVRYDNKNYGLSPSMDLGGYRALANILTAPCKGTGQLCAFTQDRQNPYLYTKNVRIHGKAYRARVEVHHSSYSEILRTNTVTASDLQRNRTEFAQDFFRKSLQNADVTFYLGHSRNGGGPDFSPPRFVGGSNKVDYKNYYQVERPGFKRLLSALDSPNQTKILGLFSCDSRDHFYGKIRKLAPNTGVISSTAVLNLTDVWTAMMGGLDSLLRGQCQQSFYRSLRLTSRNAKYITMDGVFD